jgi:hypothetical protein
MLRRLFYGSEDQQFTGNPKTLRVFGTLGCDALINFSGLIATALLLTGCTTGYDQPVRTGADSTATAVKTAEALRTDSQQDRLSAPTPASPLETSSPPLQHPGESSLPSQSVQSSNAETFPPAQEGSAVSEGETPGAAEHPDLAGGGRPASPRPYPLPSAPDGRSNPPPAGANRPARASRAPGPSSGFPVQLSAGVALPQTLPTGTAMGFSVDYRWVAGQPDPRVRYFWVIEAAGAPPMRQPVQLTTAGTLQGFVLELRPEHGPFQTYLADPRGNPISPRVPLR